MPKQNAVFHDTVFQIQPMRFGPVYGSIARHSSRMNVIRHANVVGISTAPTRAEAAEARAVTLTGRSLTARAQVFILAAGGIENARLLLASGTATTRGLGNEHDLVGRYFSDHLHVPIGVLRPRPGGMAFYQPRTHLGVRVRGAIALSEAFRTRERALGFGITLHNSEDPHDVLSIAQTSRGYQSLHHLVQALKGGRLPDRLPHNLAVVMKRAPEVCRATYRRFV